MNWKNFSAAAATAFVFSGTAQAALFDRGGGMVYDSTLKLTWLADMNYAKTSGYTGPGVRVNGTMTWDAADTWANNLSYGGFDDWRLPTVNPGDTSCSAGLTPSGFPTQYYGFNCTGGELGHLFIVDLGNKANESVLNQTGDTPEQIANLALFTNVQSDPYWAGLKYAPNASLAWYFRASNGGQDFGFVGSALYAVAVRPGDVAAVPEPQTLVLMLLGLGALTVAARRRPR